MVEHVLVPFDGSPLSEKALEYACEEFGSGTITVFYVVDSHKDETAAIGWGDHPGEWEEWLEDRREHAEELFATAESIADGHDVTIQTGAAVGRVQEMILEAIDEYDADQIVVGTHGRPHLEEFVFGSVAEALVRKSPVPVTTVR
jgi:nucleotide-binding universal stress UspA family protein